LLLIIAIITFVGYNYH